MIKHRSSEDVLSLSFTDVLTCVFGAAIALFLIFIVIAKLVVIQSTSQGKAVDQWDFALNSIQDSLANGNATIWVRAVCECEDGYLDNIEISIKNIIAGKITINRFRKMYHGRFWNIENAAGKPIILSVKDPVLIGNEKLFLTVIIGGMEVDQLIELAPSDFTNGDKRIVSIKPQRKGFLVMHKG